MTKRKHSRNSTSTKNAHHPTAQRTRDAFADEPTAVDVAALIRSREDDTDLEREAKLVVRASLLFGISVRQALDLNFHEQVTQFLESRSIYRSTTDRYGSSRIYSAQDKGLFRAVAELLVCAGRDVAGRVDGRLLHRLDRKEARQLCLSVAWKHTPKRLHVQERYKAMRGGLIARTECGTPQRETVELSESARVTSWAFAEAMVRACINYYMSTRKPFSLRDLQLAGKFQLRPNNSPIEQAEVVAATLLRDLPRRDFDAMFFRFQQLSIIPIERIYLEARRNFEAGEFFYWPMPDTVTTV